jgi:hypothetical protein
MLLLTTLLKVVQINTTLLLMLLNLLASKLEPKLITSQMLMRLILQTAVTVHFTIIAQIAIEQITPAPRLLALSVTLIPKSQITQRLQPIPPKSALMDLSTLTAM